MCTIIIKLASLHVKSVHTYSQSTYIIQYMICKIFNITINKLKPIYFSYSVWF